MTSDAPFRLLALPRYQRLGASSRLRCFDLAPYWEEEGIEVAFSPFFDNLYIQQRYRGERPSLGELLHYYRRRRAALVQAKADLVWLQIEAFPYLPLFCERRLLARRPYVLDLDDAWFHRYDRHPSTLMRRLLGRKIDRLMAGAALVVCGNGYIAERARAAGARRVEVALTPLDSASYAALPRPSGDPPVIGWIGAPQNLAYLEPIAPLLKEVTAAGRAQLLLVTAEGEEPGFLAEIPHRSLAWSEEGELAALSEMDIGIMPLPDNDWEKGKSGFKLIQYMAAGRAALASPVGINAALAESGNCALLASAPGAWEAVLLRLLDDPTLRRKLGEAGRRKASDEFERGVLARRQAGWFREVLERSRRSGPG